jgi:hypothetical protein
MLSAGLISYGKFAEFLTSLQQGLVTAEHGAFAARLKGRMPSAAEAS